jgi:hypothetical protein
MRIYASGIRNLEAAHKGRQSQAEVVRRFFQIRTRDGAGVGIAEASQDAVRVWKRKS